MDGDEVSKALNYTLWPYPLWVHPKLKFQHISKIIGFLDQ